MHPSQHGGAVVTSYVTAAGSGDSTADESRTPFTATTTSLYWLKSIDVLSSRSTSAVVAFGDSITDGTCTTLDAHDRWEDWMSVRLDLASRGESSREGARRSIVNEGIGGNTITRNALSPPPDSIPGLERLDRDVLSHAGVTHVVLFMGTNDIRREASAAQVIAGMENIIHVRQPANGDLLVPAFNCGDGIHPSPAGYYRMGKSVDLDLFEESER